MLYKFTIFTLLYFTLIYFVYMHSEVYIDGNVFIQRLQTILLVLRFYV